jgi:hypothetical protein
LDDAVEFSADLNNRSKIIRTELKTEVLLNGNQIAVMVPGGAGPPEDLMAAQLGNFQIGKMIKQRWSGTVKRVSIINQRCFCNCDAIVHCRFYQKDKMQFRFNLLD